MGRQQAGRWARGPGYSHSWHGWARSPGRRQHWNWTPLSVEVQVLPPKLILSRQAAGLTFHPLLQPILGLWDTLAGWRKVSGERERIRPPGLSLPRPPRKVQGVWEASGESCTERLVQTGLEADTPWGGAMGLSSCSPGSRYAGTSASCMEQRK